MGREQRRLDRRQQRATTADAGQAGRPPSRRSPVKVAGGSRFPAAPLAIAAGILLIAGLIAYLIYQSNSTSTSAQSPAEKAAQDRSASIPGTYVPDQGGAHFSGGLDGQITQPFCDGVPQSDLGRARSGQPYGTVATPSGSSTGAAATPRPTFTPTSTAVPTGAAGDAGAGSSTAAAATPTVPTDCYLSNPPSSGKMLGMEGLADIGGGISLKLPPDPDVYPRDVEIPRNSITHLEEHSGVFAGWNCADGDQACLDVVGALEKLANKRIDNYDDRVVVAKDLDLPVGTIGLASWTRVMDLPYTDWDQQKSEVERFIARNSCRYNLEGLCK